MNCAPGSGCCTACGGLSGFGQSPAVRALSGSEVDTLLARNPSIAARVLEWNALISTLDWSQVQQAGGLFEFTFHIPGAIPANGICFTDSSYGDVIIFPDASGVLHFTINGGCASAERVGPSGLPPLPNFAMITTLGILVIGYLVVREVKR